ncbi:hypothetical protein ABKS89_11505 [Pseudomonas sp. LABIM340]|uniref:hypothetical protein n=1 Tax=Pseudomonas sp. LABIM340 TaxID=3156585 RepID=UPI0032AFAC14
MAVKGDADLLHFRRTDLAAQMVSIFEHRLQPALTLFASEQKGMTTFLQQDFVPLARQHGFLVASVDLLAEPDYPERAIAVALQEAVCAGQSQSQNHDLALLRSLNLMVRRAKAILRARRGRVSLASGKSCNLKAELKQFNKAGKGRALLVIEATEHLASRSAFETLTAKLRALLQAPDSGVQVVFAGASGQGHAALFRRNDAPFYHYGFEMDFPDHSQGAGHQLSRRFG